MIELITNYWWMILIVLVVLYNLPAAADKVEKQRKSAEFEAKFYGPMPERTGCPDNVLHDWRKNHWNSGWYHHGALGRRGRRCYHCGEMRWAETDQEYAEVQIEHAAWLIKSPDCSIPERFMQYIPKELLDKRDENIENARIEKLERSIKYHQEQENTCIDELAEIQLAT